MPKGKRLAGATAKQQRQYGHIKASELERGEDLKTAKRIAAKTVRKRAKNISGRVRFVSGEYKGMTGVILSIIQKRYSKEPTTYRIQIDGFPKPGGWNGKVTATENQIEPMKSNPKQSKGKAALKTTGRALKGAARGILAAGSSILGAGAKALNPFSADGLPIADRKSAAWRQTSKKHKAEIAKREKYEQAIIDTARRLHAQGKYTDAQIWSALWNKFGYQGDFQNGVLSLTIDRHAYKIKIGSVNPRKKNKTIIKRAKRVIVLNKGKKKAAKRKRNLDHKDSTHQVEVSRHWRAGGLSQWQRAHHAGQHDLFSHGIKAKPKRNPKGPIPTPQNHAEYKLLGEEYGYLRALGKKTAAESALLKKIKAAMARYEKGLKRAPNASRAIHSRKATAARGASSSSRKAKTGRRVAAARKPLAARSPAAKRRGNPTAKDVRKTFAGRYSGDEKLAFPDGTPTGLAKLGRLVSIKTQTGKIAPVNGTAWLCADTRGKLHIGTPTKDRIVFAGPRHDCGLVNEIEYEESKPHLGYAKKTLFFHKLGEENGIKPRLVADGKGGLKFVGGAYKIKREGIVN